MKATVLGSGVCLPSKRRRGPGLLVETSWGKILLDCGPDVMHSLAAEGFRHQEIDLVFIGHFHPDHTLGLPHLLFASRYELEPRTKELVVMGPRGLGRLLEDFRRIYPRWLEARGYRLLVEEVAPGAPAAAGRLSFAPARHRPESLSCRIRDGAASLVYTGDTEYSPEVVGLARGAGVLVSECSFPSGMGIPSHLTPEGAGRMAREAGVGALLLTHLYPPCDLVDIAAEAAAEFSGRILAAEDGLSLEIEA